MRRSSSTTGPTWATRWSCTTDACRALISAEHQGRAGTEGFRPALLRLCFCCVCVCGPAGVPGAGGPGRCVCRWAAARPRAVRAASFARRVVSKPGQAPPPPTGTAADPSGALHTGDACGSGVPGQASPPRIRTHTGSGERNIAPAWCSSSWHGASLKQKPPRRAQNRRKLAYLRVLGRIIFHGAPQELTYGCFFFQTGPACGHRCQQLLPDRGCRGRRLYVDLLCR